MPRPFAPGLIVATHGAMEVITAATMLELLNRHLACDWGDVSDDDKKLNDLATENGERVLSAYNVGEHKIWVLTEADRSCTTILLPEEY
jgi:hypothetical protein